LQAQVSLAQHKFQASIALAHKVCIIAEVEKYEATRLRTLRKNNMVSEERVDTLLK